MKKLLLLVLITGGLTCLFGHPITVDGDPSDWIGTPPGTDQWVIDQGEGIWTDAVGDDLGDGGDAPLASDNPSAYSYPDNPDFLGTEADITEFRVTDYFEERAIYYLIRLADFELEENPMIAILIDTDHVPGSGQEWAPNFCDVRVSDTLRWEYAIVVKAAIPVKGGTKQYGEVVVYDQWWNIIDGIHSAVFDTENDLIEVCVNALFPIWGKDAHYVVMAGLQDSNWSSPEFGNFLEVSYSPSTTNGGGGTDGWSDPDIYDLCFVEASDQPNDLNNYTDDASTVIRATTSRVFHHTDPPLKYTIDGDPSDWTGVPGDVDTWTLSNGEGIWVDSEDDDLGDGGDAPNANDNPDAYSYPTNPVFLGTEADIVEWRVSDDDYDYLYFLIKLNNYDTRWVPIVSIMMDIIPDEGQTMAPHYADLLVPEDYAWDLAVTLWDGNMDVQLPDYSYFHGAHYVAFDTLNNTIEVALDMYNFFYGPVKPAAPMEVRYAVIAGLQDGANYREVMYDASEWSPGGGVGYPSKQEYDWVDPDVFDLCFVPASQQANELNTYNDVEGVPATLQNAFVIVQHPITTAICGDVNGDTVVDQGDFIYLGNYLFLGGPPPVSMWAADVNGDGLVDQSDFIYLGNYLFLGGPPPNCP